MLKNEVMYKLSQKLLLCCSYKEMTKILQNYNKCLLESNCEQVKEKPSDIIISLNLKKVQYFSQCIVLIITIIICSVVLIYAEKNYYFTLRFIIPFIFNILFPFFVFFALGGRKLIVLSKLCNYSKKRKWLQIINVGYLLMVLSMFCVILTYYTNFNAIKYIVALLNIYMIIAIASVFYFGYLVLNNGIDYFLLLCNACGVFCVILQIRAIQSSMNASLLFTLLYQVLTCYFIGLLVSGGFFVIIKKRKKYYDLMIKS